MANRTIGSSALKDDNPLESNGFSEINSRQKVVSFEDYKKAEELNNLDIKSLKEAVVILKQLNEIGGKLDDKGSLSKYISIYIGNVGLSKLDDVINKLEDLIDTDEDEEDKEKSGDELKTSVVQKAKIDELSDEYEEYIENKSEEVAQKIITELNNDERVKELISRKKVEVENELKNTVKNVFSGEEPTIETGIIETFRKIDESFVKQDIPISKSSIKTIQLEVNSWVSANEKQVNEYKGKVLEDKIKTEITKSNPELTKEEKVDVENYAKFVKNFYCSTRTVDLNKYTGATINHAENVGLSPGQVSNGWDNLQVFTGLVNSTQKPLELIDQYKALTGKIGNKIPIGIKECDSLDAVIKITEKSDKFRHLVEKTQNILNWKENLVGSIVVKTGLDKFAVSLAGKVLGEEFVKNSLVILSQKSLEQGSLIILQSFVGGGINALADSSATKTMETTEAAATEAAAAVEAATASFELATAAATAAVGTAAEASTAAVAATAAATLATATETATTTAAAATAASTALASTTAAAGTTAAAAGTAALSTTGIGAIIAGALLAIGAIKGFFKKMGISLSEALKRDLGKIGGSIVSVGIFIAGLPFLLLGAIGAVAAVPIVIIMFVFGGLFGYSTYMNGPISSMVPPKDVGDAPMENGNSGSDYVWDGGCVNRDYPTTVGTRVESDGQILTIFEQTNRNASGKIGQLYDLACVDPNNLVIVEKYTKHSDNKLDRRIVDSFYRMYEAGQAYGLAENELRLTSGYRSNQEQGEVRADWQARIAAVFNQGEYSSSGWDCEFLRDTYYDNLSIEEKIEKCTSQYAAKPGTSNHLTGRAVDLKVTNNTTLNWLKKNGVKYGFGYNYYKEDWHWEYNPAP